MQDIDIKKVNGVPQYAFLQYCDIASVCKAIKKMDGEYLGNNRLKVCEVHTLPCYYLNSFKILGTVPYYFRAAEGQLVLKVAFSVSSSCHCSWPLGAKQDCPVVNFNCCLLLMNYLHIVLSSVVDVNTFYHVSSWVQYAARQTHSSAFL